MILTYDLLHKKINLDLELSRVESNTKKIVKELKHHESNKVRLDLAEAYTNLFFEREQKVWDGRLTIILFDSMISNLIKQNAARRFTASKYPALLSALQHARDIAVFLIRLG